MDGAKERARYLLVDGHGLAFRGFYALPEMNAPDGTPTNAILGFMNMLLKAQDEWRPDITAVFFDPHGPTARDAMFAGYKDGRAPAPEGFKTQMPLIIKMTGLLGCPVIIQDGQEADDCIASAASAIDDAGGEAIILSADKDLLQVLRGRIRMARPTKGVSELRIYDESSFKEEYGFQPSAMADYLALVGDTADNVPGVPGIGDKTARALLAKYGSISAIYDHISELTKTQAAKLDQGRGAAEMSLALVVPQPVPPIDLDTLKMNEMAYDELNSMCGELGLKKLAERLGLVQYAGSASVSNDIREETINTISVAYSELSDQQTLAALYGGEGDIVVAERGGRWAKASIDDIASWLDAPEHTLITASCKKLLSLGADIERRIDRIVDIEAAHYYRHPDAKTHALRSIVGVDEGADDPTCAVKMLELWETYASSDHAESMTRVLREIDMPLFPVLVRLEAAGLHVDTDALARLSSELTSHITHTERAIYDEAGDIINLNSPKQVGDLLFRKLGLPVIKKTKTGTSTDAEVLEELALLPEPFCLVPSLILKHRELTKMLSGFVEPFLRHASASSDGCIHSTFSHTATGTGRLASSDPNVQNIPAFGEWAEKLRSAFVPRRSDGVFVSADYSQIELRVLAHLSGEERLAEAFASGRDIHRETASWVYGVAPDSVSQEERRFAKTVNFGLIYGMSAHGLAARMGVSRQDAAQMIDKYFAALPKVKEYLTRSAREAKTRGYTCSIFGRIRPLSEAVVGGRGGGAADRVAVNTPIQSAASDIAKIAMIKFGAALQSSIPSARMVLQVHDSIVCEADEKDAEDAAALLVETMESLRCIDVPLRAEPKRSRSL